MILLQMNLAVVEGMVVVVVVVVVELLVSVTGEEGVGLGEIFLHDILSLLRRSRDLGVMVE